MIYTLTFHSISCQKVAIHPEIFLNPLTPWSGWCDVSRNDINIPPQGPQSTTTHVFLYSLPLSICLRDDTAKGEFVSLCWRQNWCQPGYLNDFLRVNHWNFKISIVIAIITVTLNWQREEAISEKEENADSTVSEMLRNKSI